VTVIVVLTALAVPLLAMLAIGACRHARLSKTSEPVAALGTCALAAGNTATPLVAGATTTALAKPVTAYIVNVGSGTTGSVTPINTTTGKPGPATGVGNDPREIATTPNGKLAYVVNLGSDSVTPINTITGRAAAAIPVGLSPGGIAITPNGQKAYVVNDGSNTVTPITTATNTAGAAIKVGNGPNAIAVSPDGTTAYVVNSASGSVTPITTATGQPGKPISVGAVFQLLEAERTFDDPATGHVHQHVPRGVSAGPCFSQPQVPSLSRLPRLDLTSLLVVHASLRRCSCGRSKQSSAPWHVKVLHPLTVWRRAAVVAALGWHSPADGRGYVHRPVPIPVRPSCASLARRAAA